MLLYVIYAGSLLIDGIGLGSGLFPGGGSFAITFVPAIIAAVMFAVVGAISMVATALTLRKPLSGSCAFGQLYKSWSRTWDGFHKLKISQWN